MGDTAAIIITSRSDKFVIIASNAAGEHRHRIMVRKDSDIFTINDLKGKRIGVRKGTSTYGGLLDALEKANISPKEIDLIDLTPPIMIDALMVGSLDAFAASEPTPSAAEQKGARTLTTLGGLGNEYPLINISKE
jgi:sulfonate transport system substrate-binding protein